MGGKISLVLLIIVACFLIFQLLYQQPKEATYDYKHPFWTYIKTVVIIDRILGFPVGLYIDESNTSPFGLMGLYFFMLLNPFIIGYLIEYFYKRDILTNPLSESNVAAIISLMTIYVIIVFTVDHIIYGFWCWGATISGLQFLVLLLIAMFSLFYSLYKKYYLKQERFLSIILRIVIIFSFLGWYVRIGWQIFTTIHYQGSENLIGVGILLLYIFLELYEIKSHIRQDKKRNHNQIVQSIPRQARDD